MNLEKLESKQDVERVVDRIIKMTSRHSAFGLTDNTDIKSSLMAQLMQVVSQTKHRVQQKIDKNICDLETHSDNSDKQSKIMITCSVRIAKQGNSVQVRYPVIKSFVSTEINEHTLVYPKMNENSMNMKILKIKSKHIKPESVSKQIEVKAESSLKQQCENTNNSSTVTAQDIAHFNQCFHHRVEESDHKTPQLVCLNKLVADLLEQNPS